MSPAPAEPTASPGPAAAAPTPAVSNSPSITFEAIREWASTVATTWAIGPDGSDRLQIGDLRPAWALRIEAFNLLVPIGAAAAGISSDLGTPGIRGIVKRRGLDRAARAWLLRVQAAGSRARGGAPVRAVRDEARGGVLLLAEIATPSMLDPMLRVARELPPDRRHLVAADPRAFRAMRPLQPAATLGLPIREERAVLRRAADEAATAWRGMLGAPPRVEAFGREVTEPVMHALAPLVTRSLPWLAVEQVAVRRMIARARPDWVVVASDQHRIGRLAVGAAHTVGARVLVLQHGLPQYDLGYVPVVADAVATWSAADDAWFAARGTPANRLVRLGNPRLDDLPRLDRGATATLEAGRLGLRGHPGILIALSPNDRDRNDRLVDLGLGALAMHPDATLVVKLHPGDGRWASVQTRVRESGAVRARTRIARRDALLPLLAWADLVLVHRSTVAIEALAAGTPVAVASVGRDSADDALPAELRLPMVSSAEDLLAAAGRVATDDARRSFISDRRAALEASTGELDGGAAQRIARFLGAEP